METLYEIKEEYLNALENIEVNEDGEIVNIDEIEKLQWMFNDKAEAVALYIKGREAMSKALADEIKTLQARKKACDNKAEHLKEYLASNLINAEVKNIETSKVRLSFRKSESVEITDLDKLGMEYKKVETKYTPDKTLIKDAIKAGNEVIGATLVVKDNLQIK